MARSVWKQWRYIAWHMEVHYGGRWHVVVLSLVPCGVFSVRAVIVMFPKVALLCSCFCFQLWPCFFPVQLLPHQSLWRRVDTFMSFCCRPVILGALCYDPFTEACAFISRLISSSLDLVNGRVRRLTGGAQIKRGGSAFKRKFK